MLGDRIRTLRKQNKLTLEALAGDKLTKGMLSLIENNKAKPSMESLTYIAERLEVDVSDLLDEVSVQELRNILEKAEKIYNDNIDPLSDKYKQLITLIEPHIQHLTQGYESARLLDIYGRSLFHDKKDGWQPYCNRASHMYDQMNLTSQRALVSTFRVQAKFFNHDYFDALQLFLAERKEIETHHAYIDPLTQLDLDYYEAILQYAVGDSTSAVRIMEKAIAFSKEKKIFYLVSDLYRLAAAHGMMTGAAEKREFYKKKLKQYAEFADDTELMLFYDLLTVMTLINEEQDYKKALAMIDPNLANPQKRDSYGPWFSLEKGKALFHLGQLEEALEWLNKVEVPTYIHHPFDLSILYIKDAYIALCYLELGKQKKAITFSKVAMEHFDPLPDTSFKQFCIEAYEKINQ
ncbi:helix-turn-helix domain-containing protein [Halalkalibacter alkalisediminis]|uniref:Helix-turn-helix domain-containing protein n=2 Tax=Halalkalibacter alkalisediminis TaxID=935616 RepID=A0ABV6NA04_9BACI|nr:helix-turn-helix transcriptional regulator [Halalkalibacter alkalisediminis]